MEIFEYVNAYRHDPTLKGRTNMADVIYFKDQSELTSFYFCMKVPPSEIDDTMQEILVAVFQNLDKFKGKTDKEFWKWCYQIARNKMSDMYRKKKQADLSLFQSKNCGPWLKSRLDGIPFHRRIGLI